MLPPEQRHFYDVQHSANLENFPTVENNLPRSRQRHIRDAVAGAALAFSRAPLPRARRPATTSPTKAESPANIAGL
jgi:hypothetical protein